METGRQNHRLTAFHCIFQARVSQFPSMCWCHHLRSQLYKKPSRWPWMDSGSPDVSRRCISQNDGQKTKTTLTFFLLLWFSFRTEAEGGEIRGFQTKQLQHSISRSGNISVQLSLLSSVTLWWIGSWCRFFAPDCRSFSSSLWTSEPSFLGQVTSLSSSFTPSPRMHHLPTFSYATQPTTYTSYLSSPQPPPLNHSSSFQPGSFYYGQNQQFYSMAEDRNVVTALTNYIEGACLSMRGEEPVWRPYWWMKMLF